MRTRIAALGRWLGGLGKACRRRRRELAARWERSEKFRRRVKTRVVGSVLFIAALSTSLATVPGEYRSMRDWITGGDADSRNEWSRLVVERPPVLTDGEAEQSFVGGGARWVRATMPQVDFTVRNEGDGRVELGRARIEILASDRITACEPPQGGESGIPVAESIFVNLPLLPSRGERIVYRALHREIPPHHTTRIKLYFRSLDGEYASDLFALDVSLLGTEAGQRAEIGQFVIGTPGAVPRFSTYLPESLPTLTQARKLGDLLPSTWCYRRNLATIDRFLAMTGRRSPALQSLSYVRPPPGWSSEEDRRTAAQAAKPLLGAGDFYDGPTLALFAAQRSGNSSLLAAIRRKAVADLRHAIATDLKGEPPTAPRSAVVDARRLLALVDDDEAHALLGRSEAALRREEDVRTELAY